jgi:hypothetical protein
MTDTSSEYDAQEDRANQDAATESAATRLRYCDQKPQPPPVFAPGLGQGRIDALVVGLSKWSNGTVLHYYFFDDDEKDGSTITFQDGTSRFETWVAGKDQQDVVRTAFDKWKDVGVGLEFQEVTERTQAEVRVGFLFDFDGSWSYVGREILKQGSNDRTMNFGWDLTADEYGMTTALHEIGHTLGMPHEHQNPFSGIEWDEEAVYTYFAGPPNRWTRDKTLLNVLQKLEANAVSGSTWDPDSIMEYAFPKGLIKAPAPYDLGISPPGILSPLDISWMRSWYPAIEAAPTELAPFTSADSQLSAGEQVNYTLRPPATRTYRIGAFGASDVNLVLFENVDGDLRYVAGDDDGGEERNAQLEQKLFQGRVYVVRMRCYSSWQSGTTALMYW